MSTTRAGDWKPNFEGTAEPLTSFQPTLRMLCPSAEGHHFEPVLNWIGEMSEVAGFVCANCAEYRPLTLVVPERS